VITVTRRFARRSDEDGAISVMAALLVIALLASTALAVDVGRVAFTSRDQQGVTDRAVLDALGHLGDNLPPGATLQDIWDIVEASVFTTLEGNEEGSAIGTSGGRDVMQLEIGFQHPDCVYNPADPQPGDPEEFCVMWHQDGAGPYAHLYDPTPGVGQPVTAVRAVTDSTVQYMFAIGGAGERDVIKQAMGTNRRFGPIPGCPAGDTTCDPPPGTDCPTGDPACPPPPITLVDAKAAISVRSRLVEVTPSNELLLQEVFGDLLGMSDPPSLSLVGFDGLADAWVPLGVLGDAGANIGSVDQLLESEIRLADVFLAMHGATSDDSTVSAETRSALLRLATEVDPNFTVTVGDMIHATTEDPAALLTAQVDALTLVMHALVNAAVADGRNLLSVSLSGSDILGLDGLLGVTANLQLIEGPQMAAGYARWDAGAGRYETVARTAQVSTGMELEMETSNAEELLGPDLIDLLDTLLCLPILGILTCPSTQSVSLSAGAARAEADLARISCQDPTNLTDLTTIVRSGALVVTVDGEDLELVEAHDPETTVVVIPEVPGEGEATVSDTSLVEALVLDEALRPVFDLLGLNTGTARVASHWVDCDVPVLMANPL
jgi:uncharacterized membrane protein